MRFSTFLLALIPATALAAPIPAPAPGTCIEWKDCTELPKPDILDYHTGFLDLIGDVVGDIPGVGPVFDAIRNPELTAARFKVVEGLVTIEVRAFRKGRAWLSFSSLHLHFHRTLLIPSSRKAMVIITKMLAKRPRPPSAT